MPKWVWILAAIAVFIALAFWFSSKAAKCPSGTTCGATPTVNASGTQN